MDPAEFDRVAREYQSLHAASLGASGEQPAYFARYKIRDLQAIAGLSSSHGAGLSILDFGAGVGGCTGPLMAQWGQARIVGLDVSMASLTIGRARFPDSDWVCFDGHELPLASASFDAAIAACVFHHIDAAEHIGLLTEIRRVLKPGAGLMVYEHNPWNPLTRRAVDACAFDANAQLISLPEMRSRFRRAGFRSLDCRYRVFFPRALAWLRGLEPALCGVPMGAQYFVFGRR